MRSKMWVETLYSIFLYFNAVLLFIVLIHIIGIFIYFDYHQVDREASIEVVKEIFLAPRITGREWERWGLGGWGGEDEFLRGVRINYF